MNLTAKDMALVGLFTALIAVGAFLRVPIPFVPFTLQLFFVILAGFLLGGRLGSLAATTYLVLGLIGVPIFTEGGGIWYIYKPSFGYIVAFIPSAYLAGYFAEKWYLQDKLTFRRLIAAGYAALLLCYAVGAAYVYIAATFYLGLPMELWRLFELCFLFIIPGDSLTLCLACYLTIRILPVVKRWR